jgi:hypothetical protein
MTPTRKWFAALIGGATPIIITAIESGWDRAETAAAVTLVSGLLVAYLVPNEPTPGGVPDGERGYSLVEALLVVFLALVVLLLLLAVLGRV